MPPTTTYPAQQLALFGSNPMPPTPPVEIDGLELFEDAISFDWEQRLLSWIDDQPWNCDFKRRVQHYGHQYNYKGRRVDRDRGFSPLPAPLRQVALWIEAKGLMERAPNQVLVNEYQPGQGIGMHIDCEPCFGDTIVGLSLGSGAEMQFDRAGSTHWLKRSIYLPQRSLMVMSDDARYQWRHGIASRRSDVVDGVRVCRRRRVSVTFRIVERPTVN